VSDCVPRPHESRWAVQLRGGAWEMGEIAPHLTGSTRVAEADGGWELTADRFQTLTEAGDVLSVARELVAQINAIARVRLDHPDPISVGGVRRYRPGCGPDQWVFPEPIVARGRVGTPTVVLNGTSSEPASWEPELGLAAHDRRARAVLAFLALEPTWYSLYAALDTVLEDRRTGGRKGVRSWAKVPEATLSRFLHTANSYDAVGSASRHGPGTRGPRAPMSLGDGAELVSRIVDRWLDELRSRLKGEAVQTQPTR
jgi:hypothetical protein